MPAARVLSSERAAFIEPGWQVLDCSVSRSYTGVALTLPLEIMCRLLYPAGGNCRKRRV
jgi:hypothetical protein